MYLHNHYCYLLLAIMCPPLLDPPNGNVLWTDLSVNGVATYTCNGGFELIGSEVRTCLSDGTWNKEKPVCTGRSCKLIMYAKCLMWSNTQI